MPSSRFRHTSQLYDRSQQRDKSYVHCISSLCALPLRWWLIFLTACWFLWQSFAAKLIPPFFETRRCLETALRNLTTRNNKKAQCSSSRSAGLPVELGHRKPKADHLRNHLLPQQARQSNSLDGLSKARSPFLDLWPLFLSFPGDTGMTSSKCGATVRRTRGPKYDACLKPSAAPPTKDAPP